MEFIDFINSIPTVGFPIMLCIYQIVVVNKTLQELREQSIITNKLLENLKDYLDIKNQKGGK